jgi:hypothetical protein
MEELANAAADITMGSESEAGEGLEQREERAPGASAAASTPAGEDMDEVINNLSGDAVLPRVEDAISKVSTPPSMPCSQPFAQHLTPLDCHTV